MDEAPESPLTQRLSNRLSVSMLSDARDPEYAFAGPTSIIASNSWKTVIALEEIGMKAVKDDP
jgi:hypothetical protein